MDNSFAPGANERGLPFRGALQSVNESFQFVVTILAYGQVLLEAKLYLPHFPARHQAIDVLVETAEHFFTREFVITGFAQEAH